MQNVCVRVSMNYGNAHLQRKSFHGFAEVAFILVVVFWHIILCVRGVLRTHASVAENSVSVCIVLYIGI